MYKSVCSKGLSALMHNAQGICKGGWVQVSFSSIFTRFIKIIIITKMLYCLKEWNQDCPCRPQPVRTSLLFKSYTPVLKLSGCSGTL